MNDFLFFDSAHTFLGEQEYLNVYNFVIQAQAQRSVNWCLRLPIYAPFIQDIFVGSPEIIVTPRISYYRDKKLVHCIFVYSDPDYIK